MMPNRTIAPGSRRWTIVVILLLGCIVSFIDRSALSLAAPQMMTHLHLNRRSGA